MRRAPAISIVAASLAAAALVACAGSTPELAFADPESLAAAYDLYGGAHAGDVELTRTVKVVIDTAVKEPDGESRFDVAVAIGRYTASDAPASTVIVVPHGARLATVAARSGATMVKPLSQDKVSHETHTVDPMQDTWRFTLPGPPEGQVVELIARFTFEGTLASDAQWLRTAPQAGELLLRYDLPSDAVGAFTVVASDAKPVVTEQNGRRVIALFVKDAGREKDAAYARYTTTRASPKGYEQHWADGWAAATADYEARLVAASDGLDGGYAAPFTATGPDALEKIYAWVQTRPWPESTVAPPSSLTDPPWHAARPLKDPLEKNTLSPIDRVHLLHWLLREAGVPHRFAMARPAAFPALAKDFPVPDAFAVPLLYSGTTWLDAGCAACKPGQVRASLAGGQAIVLPAPAAGAPELITLPANETPTP